VGELERRVGLCSVCVHARRIVSGKGSVFWLCGRAADDPRFRKYPPLPVARCAGYEEGDGTGDTIEALP